MNQNNFTPAKVKYIGGESEEFSENHIYEAYFIEYWEGKRNSLHVRNNSGIITDFNPLEDFEILSDPDGLLNFHEAIVERITHRYDNELFGVTFGKKYKAIGRDKDGLFLVMDDTFTCYFYPPDWFKIITDEYNILQKQSVYYSYNSPRKKSL